MGSSLTVTAGAKKAFSNVRPTKAAAKAAKKASGNALGLNVKGRNTKTKRARKGSSTTRANKMLGTGIGMANTAGNRPGGGNRNVMDPNQRKPSDAFAKPAKTKAKKQKGAARAKKTAKRAAKKK